MKIIDMIRNLSERNDVVASADVTVVFDYLDRANDRIAELEKQRDALVAENVGFKSLADDRRTFIMNGVQLGYIKVPTVESDPALETIRVAVSPQVESPATDDAVRELMARGVDELISQRKSEWLDTYIDDAKLFAQQLREGKV